MLQPLLQCFALLVGPLVAWSQPAQSPSIGVAARIFRQGDSVVVRWAPAAPKLWLAANRAGYIVERAVIPQGAASPLNFNTLTFTRLTPQPVRPWTLEQWQEAVGTDTTKQWPMVAAQMLLGEATPLAALNAPAGSARSIGLQATELGNRHGMALFAADLDPTAATGLGLRFVDRTADTSALHTQQVVYRVSIAGGEGEQRVQGHGIASYGSIIPAANTAARGGDGEISVSWNIPPSGSYSGFWVERSDNSKGPWKRLHTSPLVRIFNENEQSGSDPDAPFANVGFTFRDTAIGNYRWYHYRVLGIDPFGGVIPQFQDSAMGRDLTPATAPAEVKGEELSQTAMNLRWEMPKTVSPDLAGFAVLRSLRDDGPFDTVTATLPATARSFTVNGADTAGSYYIVASVDTAGNYGAATVVFADIIDKIPPAQPASLEGRIDTSGLIFLKWSPVRDRDICTYDLFFANDSTDEFTRLTDYPIADTLFVDTLRLQSETRKIYYKVMALDARQNQSPLSAPLELLQPDHIAPDAPSIEGIEGTDSSVVLRWNRSSASDVVLQAVMRRQEGDTVWTKITELPQEVSWYQDTTVIPAAIYHYQLIAADASGLRSQPSNFVSGGSFRLRGPATVSGLSIQLGSDAASIELRWDYTPNSSEPPIRIEVYRAGLYGALEPYKTLPPDARSFSDSNLLGEPIWKYALRVVTATGESLLSDVVAKSVQ